jgi:hypothetical protein
MVIIKYFKSQKLSIENRKYILTREVTVMKECENHPNIAKVMLTDD